MDGYINIQTTKKKDYTWYNLILRHDRLVFRYDEYGFLINNMSNIFLQNNGVFFLKGRDILIFNQFSILDNLE